MVDDLWHRQTSRESFGHFHRCICRRWHWRQLWESCNRVGWPLLSPGASCPCLDIYLMSETKVDGIYLVVQREDNLWEAGYQHVEIGPGWSRATPRPRLFTATDLLHLVSPRDDLPHVIHVSVHSSHLLRRRRRFPDLHDTCYRPTDPLLGGDNWKRLHDDELR